MTKVTSEGGRGHMILVWRDSYPRCDPTLPLSLPPFTLEARFNPIKRYPRKLSLTPETPQEAINLPLTPLRTYLLPLFTEFTTLWSYLCF